MRISPPARLHDLRRVFSPLAGATVCAALGLGGCGSSNTETVSVSGSSAPSTHSTQTTQKAPKGTSSSAVSSPSSTSPSTGATPRSGGSAPAFVQQKAATGEGLQAALATVKAHGYTASDSSQYHPDQTLTVLLGTRAGSGDGYGQQAFFFVDGRYIGTDASAPSATIKLLAQSDTEVTLAYPLYRSHDPLCCPGGGQSKVRFQLNNGKLVALDPIPPVSSATGLSRQ